MNDNIIVACFFAGIAFLWVFAWFSYLTKKKEYETRELGEKDMKHW
ncbi:hypothetical protein [Acidithiobacillus ferrianus]